MPGETFAPLTRQQDEECLEELAALDDDDDGVTRVTTSTDLCRLMFNG